MVYWRLLQQWALPAMRRARQVRGESAELASVQCWKCGKMHSRNKATTLRDMLCEDTGLGQSSKWHKGIGPVWITLEALCEHGLLLDFGQTPETYPAAWHKPYRDSVK